MPRAFSLENILACVAMAKEKSVPYRLPGLLCLIEYMTGARVTPLQTPDFQIYGVMCGLALMRQHAVLERVHFPDTFAHGRDFVRWLAQQRQTCGDMLPVTSIQHDDLSPYREQTEEIVRRIITS